MIPQELATTLDRLEVSGDKVLVAFELSGQTHSIPGTMTVEEARVALSTADGLGATRLSVRRFES